MSEPRYQVAWPYLTVKILDGATGATTVVGYTEGGILPPTADAEDVKRLVAKGALREIPASENQQLAAEPKPTPKTGESSQPAALPGTADAPAKPAQPPAQASKAEWVAYAVAMRPEGVSEEGAKAKAEAMSKAELAAKFGA